MISPYNSIITHTGDDWQEFLDRLMLIDIFMPVIQVYKDIDDLKCVIKYITFAYSPNSDKIILGLDWKENKKQIFEFVQVRPVANLYESLVLLKSEAVVETINRWLNFQENDTFTQLQMLKDLRVEMQLSATAPIKKASGEIDFDQKFKNAEYANKLKAMIKDLEEELLQNNNKLKDAVREVKSIKTKNTIGPEFFSK